MAVAVHDNPTTQLQSRHRKANPPVDYDGMVWCVTVPSGAVMVRREGRIFISGNSGFPKSLDISKALDKQAGIHRGRAGKRLEENGSMTGANVVRTPKGSPATAEALRWEGYGTALKPAWEPIIVCQARRDGTFANNVVEHGCGALNIDACRIGEVQRRFPANLVLGGASAGVLDTQVGSAGRTGGDKIVQGTGDRVVYGEFGGGYHRVMPPKDAGGPSRFFYKAKASRKEREAGLEDFDAKTSAELTGRQGGSAGLDNPRASTRGSARKNTHPTVKPIDLARYFATMLLPPPREDGQPRRLLVPFSGSGSEMIGALLAGWDEVVGIEMSQEYCEIARARIAHWTSEAA
ncbi:MAG: hypothetical protein AAFW98_05855, partial [Pseudomonadota bacterium]